MKSIRILPVLLVILLAAAILGTTAFAETMDSAEAGEYLDSYADNMLSDPNFDQNVSQAINLARQDVSVYATGLSLLPPVVAIVLALLTKEVFLSLFAGIITGGLLYANFSPWGTVTTTFDVMVSKLSSSSNAGILVFLVILGTLVALVNKAGGSEAYGRWASRHIKTRVGAQLATIALGVLIFIDDYFNCLTVGSVMRPVTDKQKVSREKLAYLIDATAAPVCIIAPISSWAAAVSSVAPEGQGLSLFIRSIPYNLYALLTIGTVVFLAATGTDFGKMKGFELEAMHRETEETQQMSSGKGTVWDLILPICVLIVSCICSMVYTGGYFDPSSEGFHDIAIAFSNSDASVGLVLGGFVSLVAAFLLYLPRKILTFSQFAESIPEGFKAMVSAILILTFAWTLSGITNLLGAKVFVAEFVRGVASGLQNLLPAIVFVIGCGLAFATGTSWGTFGVLLPIVCAVFPSGELMVISVSACLAGAVCGDHCSPISDTTIMASAGAQCQHINHVSTQLPYAMTVAAVSFFGYILAGFVQNVWIVLPVSAAVMLAVLLVIRAKNR